MLARVDIFVLKLQVLGGIFHQLVGIYPTLVTALVMNERTLFQSSESPTYIPSRGAVPSQSIHFKTQYSSVQIDEVPLGSLVVLRNSSRSSIAIAKQPVQLNASKTTN